MTGNNGSAYATFTAFTIGTVIVVGALSFFAALALGPIAEQVSMPAVGALR